MWGVSYWVFPVIAGFSWIGMLIAMLVVWTSEGRPAYPSYNTGQTIAYISDIGAQELRPVFIACSAVMAVFLDLSFISEQWLRHIGRLAQNKTRTETVLTALSFVFAAIGTAGIILLTIFDTFRYPRLHDVFLLLFIGGYLISAIFICWEYQRLGIHYRQHRILRISFWMKLSFILVDFILAIAFAVTTFKGSPNVAAILEWTIAFIFTLYAVSFFIDLIPAVHTKRMTSKQTALASEQNDQESQNHGRYYGDAGIQRTDVDNTGGMAQVHGAGRQVNGVQYGGRPDTPSRTLANNF